MRTLRRVLSSAGIAVVALMTAGLATDGFGENVEAAEVVKIGEDVEAVSEPWYNYAGHTGYNQDGAFILDPYFVNAVAYQNFTINGYTIDGSEETFNEYADDFVNVEVYDQLIMKYADSEALGVNFPVNEGAVSKSELFDVYGETENAAPTKDGDKAFYNYQIEDQHIQFVVENGWVIEVRYFGDLLYK